MGGARRCPAAFQQQRVMRLLLTRDRAQMPWLAQRGRRFVHLVSNLYGFQHQQQQLQAAKLGQGQRGEMPESRPNNNVS